MKIGIMFGNPETTTGGHALKFYASVRMDIRSIGKIEDTSGPEKVIVGIRARVKVVKNKVAPPFKTAEFDIMYNKGISYFGDLLDLGIKYERVHKSGAFYTYGDTKLGQGREAAKSFLAGNEKVVKKIEDELKKLISGAAEATTEKE